MPEIISLIDDESELLDVLGARARNRTMEERAAKVMRMTTAIGKVPLFVRRLQEAGRSRFNETGPSACPRQARRRRSAGFSGSGSQSP
jgi:hypothetical protein